MELTKAMEVLKVLLVLSCVPGVPADILHEDYAITGCSAADGEDMYALDGEELWYADFSSGRGVVAQPSFVDPITYPGHYEQAVADQAICKSNLDICDRVHKNPPLELVPPSSRIYTRDEVELGKKNILICHVTGFYPAPVKVYWTKNGKSVTEGTSINVPFSNKEGVFRQSSRLDFIPQQGDTYSCSVHHPALENPLTRFWDVQVKQPSIGPAVFCGLGLTLGLLGVATGTFFLIKGNECS